jgi:hypothetical protein
MKTPLSSRHKALASWLLAVCCLTLALVPAVNANLIVNGSFENPVVPEGYFSVMPTGWAAPLYNYTGGIIHPPGSLGPLYPPAQHGLQYELLNGGSIFQDNIVLTAGDYQLTWFDNTLTDRSTQYQVYMYDSLNNPVASLAVGTFHGGDTWNARSLPMTLAAGSYKLEFMWVYGAGYPYYALDNVSLDLVAVPEPTTMIAGALLLLPFGATTLRALRRRRSP